MKGNIQADEINEVLVLGSLLGIKHKCEILAPIVSSHIAASLPKSVNGFWLN
jgi:hypothetical protein